MATNQVVETLTRQTLSLCEAFEDEFDCHGLVQHHVLTLQLILILDLNAGCQSLKDACL